MTGQQRLDVTSRDGTSIAVWVDGEGPAIVLVHGSLQDHTMSRGLVDELKADRMCCSMDRRGFGASGDSGEYSIGREFEDVAAVVDAVAEKAGPVALWGHSFGASCAMGAARLTHNISHLVLYEPSFGLQYPPGSLDAVDTAVASGDAEAAIRLVLITLLGMSEADVDARRGTREWELRLSVAGTVAREGREEENWVYQPGQFDSISARTLLLAGSDSPNELRTATADAAAAIPGAEIVVMEGQQHVAHRTNPAMVAALVREFLDS